MAVALVLSGGAAQGSFEVGALQYLYENGFFANVVCSVSVGSVNGLQLAHGGDAASQKAAFDKLKLIWESLQVNGDMYREAPWLMGVSPGARQAIEDLMAGVDWSRLVDSSWVVFPPFFIAAVGDLIGQVVTLVDELKRGAVRSVFTLAPTETQITNNLDPAAVANSGVELRLVSVSLDSGAIRYVTQTGKVIEKGRPAGPPPRRERLPARAHGLPQCGGREGCGISGGRQCRPGRASGEDP